MPSSKVPKGKGKGKGNAKGKGKGKGKADPVVDNRRTHMMDAQEETRAAAAAIESGEVARVCKFLRQMFPEGARSGGAELKCMRRAVSLLDTRWKAEIDRKRKATFSSEDKGVVDAVLMGGVYLPSDTFANVVDYLDHGTAIRSTPCSRSWWRMISGLPAASHVDTNLGKGMGWSAVVTQLKNMRASNPLRSVSRLSFGYGLKLGSFAKLARAAGGPLALTHLDLTRCKGVGKIDFAALAKALPSLRGLAVECSFYSPENSAYAWLRGLTGFVRSVKLQSLQLRVTEWETTTESAITDSALEDLAYGPRSFSSLFMLGLGFFGIDIGDGESEGGGGSARGGDGDPCTLCKLWLSAPSLYGGPSITGGMAAIGGNMPHLEELVVDRLKVTDDGWRRFAAARADAAAAAATASNNGGATGGGGRSCGRGHDRSPLRRIRIRAEDKAAVPSAATRDLLGDTVSTGVTLHLDGRRLATVAAVAATGGGQYVDCEGAPIELDDKEDKPAAKTVVLGPGSDLPGGGVAWM